MRWILAFIFLGLQGVAAAAQDDKGFVIEFLEESLSELGRDVQITGFRGALSSRAEMDILTIADDDGVWLTLENAVLDWNRSAILGGRIEINEISATRIELLRLPQSESTVSPESSAFALPELPVSIRIDAISVGQVVLGESILGEPITLSTTGSLVLKDGEGAANLEIARVGGPEGRFSLVAGYSNISRVLAFNLALQEAENGLAATLLQLPDSPALALTINGNAPIDDFAASVALSSGGQPRLAGKVTTFVSPQANSEIAGDRRIDVDIAGDLTALFAPEYQAFFGDEVALQSQINVFADGRMALDALTLSTSALQITGEMALGANSLPEHFQLDINLQDRTANTVLLPLSGVETRLRSASLHAKFDSRFGNAWSLSGNIQGFQRAEMEIETIDLVADGVIQSGETTHVTARIEGAVGGIHTTDASVSEALGTALKTTAILDWRSGQPLALTEFNLESEGMSLTGAGTVGGIESALFVEGTAQADIENLSRLSRLLGQPLSGQVSTELSGSAAVLTGAFDVELNASAVDLRVGVEKLDDAMSGESQLNISALRNTEGFTVRRATITTQTALIEASGPVATGQSNLAFKAALQDLGQFVEGLSGKAELSGRLIENASGWTANLKANGPNQISISAEVALPTDAPLRAKVQGRIGSVAWVLPELDGPASVEASLTEISTGWRVNAKAEGPGNSTIDIAGTIAPDTLTAALSLNGRIPLGLLNRRLQPNSIQGFARFDLGINGPLALNSLSGQVRTEAAEFVVPALRNALTELNTTITLTAGTAQIQATTAVASGGEIVAQGRVGLQAPFASNLTIAVQDVILNDPELYETLVNGALDVSGTLPGNLSASGQIILGRTEILVPSTGISSFGDVLNITHLNEPSEVRRTRAFAGLLGGASEGSSSSGPAIGLDVQIIAQNRIFIRGRGLDAELGGQLRLTGSSANIVPVGRFDLIRGRLDILGKRLNLDEGSATLQGGMIPTLRLVARTTANDAQLSVVVEGPADAPEIRFESVPELPSDEVLARLLFGRDLESISALQAVQLASAVATLAGRGGVGIVERLRQKFGVSDLDVTTNDNGEASLSIGKYISDNAYTTVEIDSDGQSRINLNLDLTPSTILRGEVGTDGSTGIGIYFEKDY